MASSRDTIASRSPTDRASLFNLVTSAHRCEHNRAHRKLLTLGTDDTCSLKIVAQPVA